MLALYAITPAEVPPPDGLAALLGSRVAVHHAEQGGVRAADREVVLAFGRRIQELADRSPMLLPVRFGTTVEDLAALGDLVREHEAAWTRRLRAVAGCGELVVHVEREHPAPAVASPPRTGRDYLLRRAELVHSVEVLRDEVAGVLRPVARDVRSLPAKAGRERLAVLVPRAAATVACTDVRRWAAGHPDVAVAVTGPWPPFSFAEDVA